jgi:myo-inositol-1(or 4)-monophosphatase
VSVALAEDRAIKYGVLAAPARDELWTAEQGRGAWRNGQPLRVSQRSVFEGSRVPADSLPRVDQDLVMVAKPNSIALRIAMVAAGEADLLATLRWGREWDIAAAALIAAEAGATVTGALGQPLTFNSPDALMFGVVVTAPGIHEAAVERLRERAMALV